jgi:peptidoglycan/LPS O-acetylase OafA/YrhL
MPRPNPNEFRLIRKYMPELDIFRGIAVLLVVVYHGFYWMNHGTYRLGWQTRIVDATVVGWLGVNLFFILSGFLITGILLDTRTGQRYYRTFYTKRALRILPALAATLILVVVLRQTSLSGLLLSAFFLSNYAVNLGVNFIYAPLWSLAVEEHFYLLWPTIVHRLKTGMITTVAATLCLLEPALRFFSGRFHLGDPHENTHLVADYLATGALLAIFARSRFASRANSLLLSVGLSLAGIVAMLAGSRYGILHRGKGIGDAFQVIPFNLIFASSLLLALALQLRFFASRWAWPLRYLSHISYGLYLYHLIAFSIVGHIMAHYGVFQGTGDFQVVVERFVLMFIPSVLIADASRRWLEQPFLDLRKN